MEHGTANTANHDSQVMASAFVANLSSNKETTLDDYELFFNTRRYLWQKTVPFENSTKARELGALLGYNTTKGHFLDKFKRHREQYYSLERDIPYRYLDALDVKRDELEVCMETDLEQYELARLLPRYPRSAAIRLIPAVYAGTTFPEGTTEAEAIDLLNTNERYQRHMRFIVYSGLLSIRLLQGPDAVPEYSWFRPRWTWKRTCLTTGPRVQACGTTRIK